MRPSVAAALHDHAKNDYLISAMLLVMEREVRKRKICSDIQGIWTEGSDAGSNGELRTPL